MLLEAPNSHKIEECEDDTTGTASGPDSAQLLRRGALVPPKIVDDPSEPVTDPVGAFVRCDSQELLLGGEENNDSSSGGGALSGFSGSANRSTFPRRSSAKIFVRTLCPCFMLVPFLDDLRQDFGRRLNRPIMVPRKKIRGSFPHNLHVRNRRRLLLGVHRMHDPHRLGYRILL